MTAKIPGVRSAPTVASHGPLVHAMGSSSMVGFVPTMLGPHRTGIQQRWRPSCTRGRHTGGGWADVRRTEVSFACSVFQLKKVISLVFKKEGGSPYFPNGKVPFLVQPCIQMGR